MSKNSRNSWKKITISEYNGNENFCTKLTSPTQTSSSSRLSLKLEPVESKLSKSNKTLYDNQTSVNQSTFYVSQNDVNDFASKPSRTSLSSSFQFNPSANGGKFKGNNNSFTFDHHKLHVENSMESTIRRSPPKQPGGQRGGGSSFVPAHRKSSSLGANVVLPNLSSFKKPEVINYENRYLLDDALLEENSDLTSLYKEELRFNKVPSLSSLNSQPAQSNGRTDESSCCDTQNHTSISINQSSITSNNTSGHLNSTLITANSDHSNHQSFEQSADTDARTDPEHELSDSSGALPKNPLNIKYQGYIKRKTVLKEGKKPTLATWVRYWVILNSTSLIFYSSKSLRGCSRSHFKSTPTKCISLRSSLINVKLDEEACSMDTFILTDDNDKTVYKFKTNTQLEAITWCREISQILANPSFNF